MANEKIGIDFYATTAAAVAEIDKLSEATKAAADAADAAGKGQKGLGRDIKETRAAQIEATEATRKAKEAQQVHTLTVQKFGEQSKEAAASEARLTKATEEATRAATVAAQSLNKTAQAVAATAAAEDGNLSPATKRAAAQLERMGKDAERTSGDLNKLSLQSKGSSSGFDIMGMASGKLMAVLGPAALGGSVIALAGWLGEASEKTLQFETRLANLPFALDSAQKATRGLVSESELAAAASSAMSLGVVKSEAEFSKFAAAAAKLALKNGVSTGQMLGDLTTAVGRGSKEILDNASIMVDSAAANEAYAASIGKTVAELTEVEKKGALQAEMMRAISAAAEGVKVDFDGNAAALSRLKVSYGDMSETMERGAVNAFGSVVSSINGVSGELQRMQENVDATNRSIMQAQNWSQGFKDLSLSAGETATSLLGMTDVVANFHRVLNDPAAYEQAANGLTIEREKADLMAKEAHFAELQQKALEKINKEQESFLEAQAAASVVYGPALPPKEEKKKKGPKKKTALDIAKGTEFRHDESDLVNEMFAADAAAEEAAAQKIYEIKQQGLEQELEILDARGLAEEEAQRAREAIIDRQLNAEREFAQQQARMAKTDATREAAQTRMEAAEYQRRLVNIRRAAAAEQAEHARKVAITEKVTARVSDLGTAMVDAAWEAAEGQRGAGLQALGDYLKTVSKQMAIKALVETALGAAALAGVVTAGLAPGHFAAAGIAAGVAVAAGGAGVAFSAAGDARAVSGQGRPESANDSGSTPSGAANGPPSSNSQPKRELDAQEVPISYGSAARPMPVQTGDTININLAGATFIGSKGPEDAAQQIQKMLRQGKAAGER